MTEPNIDQALSEYDDPRRPLLRAIKFGGIGLVIVTIVSLIVWGRLSDLPGIYGVVIGVAIGGGFVLITAVNVLVTSRTNPTVTGVIVFGGWLLKIVVLLVVVALIRDLQFYDRTALVVTAVCALVVTLATEAWGVVTARVSYIS